MCGFHKKHKNVHISRTKYFFTSNKKIHKLRFKGYFMAKNRFAAEGTFNNKIIVLKIDINHEIFQNRPDFK